MTTNPIPGYHTNSRRDLQPYIMALNPKRVLDVGCAEGRLGEALKEQGVEWVEGVENDWDVYPKAKERLDEVYVCDAGNLYFSPDRNGAEFDVVVFGDILEHLEDPWGVVKSARRWLVPGGHIVVSIPNVGFADVVLKCAAQHWCYTNSGILDRTHLRFFTKEGVRDLFSDYTIETLESLHLAPDFDTMQHVPEGELRDVGIQVGGKTLITLHGIDQGLLEQLYTIQYVCVARK